ncbi:MAG: nuclear transport factor 2 family protein [Xanthomonadales bacterium]|nr:nuclear transport factor 2 family protein [Xanthomonadales bacterium]
MKQLFLATLCCMAVTLSPVHASNHETALKAVALDYAMGWYLADADRMASALHPELAKRALLPNREDGTLVLSHMGKDRLVAATGAGGGSRVPEAERQADVEVLDVYGNAAVVKLTMRDWVDYLQLIREDERWQIINVLWELNPED